MGNPFRYFKTSPEIIRLAVMLYVRFPLSGATFESINPSDGSVATLASCSGADDVDRANNRHFCNSR
jgi:hypothetical protein